MKKSAPAVEKSVPAEEESAPAVEKSAPVEEKSAPAVEKSAPAEEMSAPAVEKSAPAVEKSPSTAYTPLATYTLTVSYTPTPLLKPLSNSSVVAPPVAVSVIASETQFREEIDPLQALMERSKSLQGPIGTTTQTSQPPAAEEDKSVSVVRSS